MQTRPALSNPKTLIPDPAPGSQVLGGDISWASVAKTGLSISASLTSSRCSARGVKPVSAQQVSASTGTTPGRRGPSSCTGAETRHHSPAAGAWASQVPPPNLMSPSLRGRTGGDECPSAQPMATAAVPLRCLLPVPVDIRLPLSDRRSPSRHVRPLWDRSENVMGKSDPPAREGNQG